mgnify:CR=1 FL=1
MLRFKCGQCRAAGNCQRMGNTVSINDPSTKGLENGRDMTLPAANGPCQAERAHDLYLRNE